MRARTAKALFLPCWFTHHEPYLRKKDQPFMHQKLDYFQQNVVSRFGQRKLLARYSPMFVISVIGLFDMIQSRTAKQVFEQRGWILVNDEPAGYFLTRKQYFMSIAQSFGLSRREFGPMLRALLYCGWIEWREYQPNDYCEISKNYIRKIKALESRDEGAIEARRPCANGAPLARNWSAASAPSELQKRALEKEIERETEIPTPPTPLPTEGDGRAGCEAGKKPMKSEIADEFSGIVASEVDGYIAEGLLTASEVKAAVDAKRAGGCRSPYGAAIVELRRTVERRREYKKSNELRAEREKSEQQKRLNEGVKLEAERRRIRALQDEAFAKVSGDELRMIAKNVISEVPEVVRTANDTADFGDPKTWGNTLRFEIHRRISNRNLSEVLTA